MHHGLHAYQTAKSLIADPARTKVTGNSTQDAIPRSVHAPRRRGATFPARGRFHRSQVATFLEALMHHMARRVAPCGTAPRHWGNATCARWVLRFWKRSSITWQGGLPHAEPHQDIEEMRHVHVEQSSQASRWTSPRTYVNGAEVPLRERQQHWNRLILSQKRALVQVLQNDLLWVSWTRAGKRSRRRRRRRLLTQSKRRSIVESVPFRSWWR